MSKKLPARAASRSQYVFWIIIAVVAVTWGMLQFMRPDGNPFIGLIAVVGFAIMAMRETSLRRQWKKQQKELA